MDNLQLASHAYAIRSAGFTRIEAQVTGAWLDELRELTDRSLAASMRIYRACGKLKFVSLGEGYEASRCLYCWGDAAVRLLDLDCVHAVAKEVLGEFRLWDLSALSVAARRNDAKPFALGFHRDFPLVDTRVAPPQYLWCFFCLYDTTPQTGPTWVVPGSHHLANPKFESDDQLRAFARPISQQICAAAGDLIVLNPTALHSAGQNVTDRPRRLINIGLCSAGNAPLLDHWAIAGPTIQPRVNARVRQFMQSDVKGLDKTWDALPEGWSA